MTTHIFEDEADRRRHIDAWERAEHRWVDWGMCEICGTGMQLVDAYRVALDLLEEAIATLEHSVCTPEINALDTVIALDAARVQLLEDTPEVVT